MKRIIALVLRGGVQHANVALKAQDIGSDKLRGLFLACSTTIDTVELASRLSDTFEYAEIDAIGKTAAYPAKIEEYIRLVAEGAMKRKLSAIADSIKANIGSIEPLQLAESARGALASVASGGDGGASKVSGIVTDRFSRLEALMKRKWAGEDVLTGVPTGVAALDAFLGGYPRGVVTAIGALPGMGKSSLGKACAMASAGGRFGVHLFSLEDAKDPYSDRILSEIAGVSSNKMRALDLTQQELERMRKASKWVEEKGTWLIDDRRNLSPSEMVRCVRANAEQNNTSLVVLDYIQQVRSSDPRSDERQAIDECVTSFAGMAREMNIAVIVFSQLNRSFLQTSKSGSENMEDKKPKMHHLKFSGKIAEEAKCVLMLHRDAYHDPNLPDDRMEIIVAKNNQGQVGTVIASWNPERTKVY